jgi:DNA polymerase gamma 1
MITRRLMSNSSVFNELGIQMLPSYIHKKVFDKKPQLSQTQVDIATSILKRFDLYGKTQDIINIPHLEIPDLVGSNLNEHFGILGKDQAEPYLSMAKQFSGKSLPDKPHDIILQSGWTRYSLDGTCERVEFPDDDCLVFDVEVQKVQPLLPTWLV